MRKIAFVVVMFLLFATPVLLLLAALSRDSALRNRILVPRMGRIRGLGHVARCCPLQFYGTAPDPARCDGFRWTCGILIRMRHSDVDTDGVINCNGELTQLAEETDNDGQRLLFLRCSLCGMEFLFCLDSSKMLMSMPGPIH